MEIKASLFAQSNGNGLRKAAPRTVAEYDCREENGEPLYQIVRHEPKDFRQHTRVEASTTFV